MCHLIMGQDCEDGRETTSFHLLGFDRPDVVNLIGSDDEAN